MIPELLVNCISTFAVLVLVQRFDTDGDWEDPGDVGMQMGMMIVNARIF
jgi:hypothetical protein